MKNYSLFIDESGIANPEVKASPVYVLSGCMINDKSRQKLKIKADQIKYKYWGKTNVVLHSREIGRREHFFKILKNPEINKNFEKDLFKLLSTGGYEMFFVVIDKKKAKKNNWKDAKVYKETSKIMVCNFILALLAKSNAKGRVVVESATAEKDFYFHKACGFYLSKGLHRPKVPYTKVQKILTEVSFVTKRNHDIEEQVADLLAYGARLKYLKEKLKNNYQKEIKNIVEKKLFKTHPNTGKKKRKYYSKIKEFAVLP